MIITGRRESRLHELKEVLETKGVSVLPLCFDVRNETEVNEALLNLPEAWKNVDILINNAGLAAGLDSIQEGNTDNWNSMIDTNMKGLLFVTRNIAPGMVKRKYGQIINIGSISSKEVYPNGNVYCATKHAVEAITKGMRMDLLPHNIRVTKFVRW